MRLLVIGGTRFLGRHIVESALAREYTVTLFNRGQSNPDLFPGVERLQGDRDGGLEPLRGRHWDAVVDTCGYFPRVVRASAELLAPVVGHYTFVSTISVYDDLSTMNMDESQPVGTLDDETVEEVTGETYGPLKALCEQAVRQAYPTGALIVRPGLIVGPHDPSDRFTYWPCRVADGGEVLVPGQSGMPTQFVDVRDLAAWILDMVEARQFGTFNATGPDYPLTMKGFLRECRSVVNSDVEFTWISDEFLLDHDVTPWTELPLWIPASAGKPGMLSADCSRAFEAGLSFRPLCETIADTLDWARQRPQNYEWRAGMTRQLERELMAEWHEREGTE